MASKQTNIRSATKQERMRSRAVGISALLIMVMLTVAITFTAIAIAQPNESNQPPPEVGAPIVFGFPLAHSPTFIKPYSGTQHQFNANLSQWRAHRAVVMLAPAGTQVLAPAAGQVTGVTNTRFGTQITIEHSNGYRTLVQSIDNNVTVSPGDRVEQGQKLGIVGTTSTYEFVGQPQLRLQMRDNQDRSVDPARFINFNDK